MIEKYKAEIEELCAIGSPSRLIEVMSRVHNEAPNHNKPSVVNYFLKPWRQEFHDELVVAQAKKEHAAKNKKGG